MKSYKGRWLLMILLILSLILVLATCATTGKRGVYEKELYGLWINPEYDTSAGKGIKPYLFPGKWLWFEFNKKVGVIPYDKTTDADDDWGAYIPHWYDVNSEWVDDSGAIYFNLTWIWIVSQQEGYEYYIFLKLSPDKLQLEFVLSEEEFPSEIDTSDDSYHIYYRE